MFIVYRPWLRRQVFNTEFSSCRVKAGNEEEPELVRLRRSYRCNSVTNGYTECVGPGQISPHYVNGLFYRLHNYTSCSFGPQKRGQSIEINKPIQANEKSSGDKLKESVISCDKVTIHLIISRECWEYRVQIQKQLGRRYKKAFMVVCNVTIFIFIFFSNICDLIQNVTQNGCDITLFLYPWKPKVLQIPGLPAWSGDSGYNSNSTSYCITQEGAWFF